MPGRLDRMIVRRFQGVSAMQEAEAALRNASEQTAWSGFVSGRWQHEIDVRDFIVLNAQSYHRGEEFLAPISDRTKAVFEALQPYFAEEAKKGVLDVDPSVPSSITSHPPGYIDRANEVVVGLQTDKPFRRAIMPKGGYRMVETGLEAAASRLIRRYGKSSRNTAKRTMTAVVRRVYAGDHALSPQQHHHGAARRVWPRPHHRRLSARGAVRIDALLAAKKAERTQIDDMWPSDEVIRLREELAEQMRALEELRHMAQITVSIFPVRRVRRARRCSGPICLSRRDQRGERRGDVDRTDINLPGRLHRARHRGGNSVRERGAGAD
jgi:formate C-acetyltransferase